MELTRECAEGSQESLVAYLYGECDESERERVERHVAACLVCAAELKSLRSVRGLLVQWETPEPALGLRLVADREREVPWWRRTVVPTWGLVTAAALVLVVAVSLANIELRYDASGFTVSLRGGQTQVVPGSVQSSTMTASAPRLLAGESAPWRADLARLEDRLRQGIIVDTMVGPVTSAEADHANLLREIEQLISQSELRQQQEVAVLFTAFVQEFDTQRRADQQRFHQDLGALEGVTDYLVQVSQR